MDANELAQLMKMPQGAVYTPALGQVGAAMYTYTEMQMAEYALAHKLFERDKWAKVLAESCDDYRSQMMGEPRYTEQQIADACMAAEIPDSKCESLLIALAA